MTGLRGLPPEIDSMSADRLRRVTCSFNKSGERWVINFGQRGPFLSLEYRVESLLCEMVVSDDRSRHNHNAVRCMR